MRETPSSARRIGDGEPESRRPQARNAGKRQKRTWHALQQADVEVHPAGGAAARVSGGGGGGGGGGAGRRPAAAHSSHSTTTPSILVNGSAADVCHSCGDCGRERGESGEQRAPGTARAARAARTPGGPADLQDQVVQRVADAVVLAVERVREVVCAEGRRAVSTQTAANFSRRQIETRRAQVAAWCSEYCAGWGRAFRTLVCAGLQLC